VHVAPPEDEDEEEVHIPAGPQSARHAERRAQSAERRARDVLQSAEPVRVRGAALLCSSRVAPTT